MEFFRTWVAPPVIGAVIGLFTNWLAIKMLFRPLRELRVLGVRVPFTPGILPREKARLARSIGDTVAAELLTPVALRKRISDPSLLGSLESTIRATLDGFLAMPAASLLGLGKSVLAVPEADPPRAGTGAQAAGTGLEEARPDPSPADPQGAQAAGTGLEEARPDPSPADPQGAQVSPLLAALKSSTGNILSSGAFRNALAKVLAETARRFMDLRLGEVLGADKAAELAEMLAGSAGRAADEGGVSRLVDSWYDAPRTGFGAGPLLPAPALEPLARLAVESLYASSIPVIEAFMADPVARKDLEARANEIVHRVLGRLGPVQRLIVTAANYEATIVKGMPATIDDMARMVSGLVRDPAMPGKVVKAVESRLFPASAEPGLAAGSGAGAGVPPALPSPGLSAVFSREALKIALVASLRGLSVNSGEFASNASRKAAFLSDRRLGDLASGVEDSLRDIAAASADVLSDALAGKGAGSALFSGIPALFSDEFAAGLGEDSLGAVLGITPEFSGLVSASLASSGLELLGTQAERVVEALDVRKMVVDRIDELEMIEVERIILAVVDRELMWITLLGGILGGAIGVIQSVIYSM